jgi:hypothetical protein
MTITTAALPLPDVSETIPHADPMTPLTPADLHIEALVRELKASWHPLSTVADRRREHRIPCDLAATLVPLDEQGRNLAGESLGVRIKDVSQHGVGVGHAEPMPHRLVLLAFTTTGGEPVRLVVRLKWCRFKRTSGYESGGQMVRVLRADDKLFHRVAPPDRGMPT